MSLGHFWNKCEFLSLCVLAVPKQDTSQLGFLPSGTLQSTSGETLPSHSLCPLSWKSCGDAPSFGKSSQIIPYPRLISWIMLVLELRRPKSLGDDYVLSTTKFLQWTSHQMVHKKLQKGQEAHRPNVHLPLHPLSEPPALLFSRCSNPDALACHLQPGLVQTLNPWCAVRMKCSLVIQPPLVSDFLLMGPLGPVPGAFPALRRPKLGKSAHWRLACLTPSTVFSLFCQRDHFFSSNRLPTCTWKLPSALSDF